MAIELPSASRLKLNQTLSQWRQWDTTTRITSKPEIVKTLGTGISNHSVLVAANERFVVRVDGINPQSHGIHRQSEWQSLRAAYRRGIAPRPCYFNPELGSLVTAFLAPDHEQPVELADVALLLKAIHRLPARRYRLDLRERIDSYQRQLMQRSDAQVENLLALRPGIDTSLEFTAQLAEPPVLCHNDLLQANRLYSAGRLFALDWEYSAMCSAYYDLAVIVAGDHLSPEQIEQLINTYWGDGEFNFHLERLQHYVCIYRYVECLWYAVRDELFAASDAAAKRTQMLRRDLNALR
ncbi:MAG: phosphotransferase [Pseudomonadota bacterium]